jgi:hypothetical protein
MTGYPMPPRTRIILAASSAAAACMIALAGIAVYDEVSHSRSLTVRVCGRSYPVTAGRTLTVTIGGASCREVKVTGGAG